MTKASPDTVISSSAAERFDGRRLEQRFALRRTELSERVERESAEAQRSAGAAGADSVETARPGSSPTRGRVARRAPTIREPAGAGLDRRLTRALGAMGSSIARRTVRPAVEGSTA